jgi:hypothetical protein
LKSASPSNGAAHVRRSNGHAGADECRCPLCQSILDPARYEAVVGAWAMRESEIERRAEAQSVAREALVRREATAAANAANADKLTKAEEARKAAEQAVKSAKSEFETALRERLETATEAAAKSRDAAISEVTVKHFAEVQRLLEKNREMERLLEKKTANELGENGEIDMFEALVSEFGSDGTTPGDQLTRIAKGTNGADIEHRVFSHGECVGVLLIEVKNVRRWSNGWVPKLRQDMIRHGASHGVLVTTAFAHNEHQLAVRDGIVISSPARAIAVVHILRRAIIQFHALRLTNQERDSKIGKLYELLTSDCAVERWERLSSATSELVEIESANEAHERRQRDKRLAKVRAIVSVHDEFTTDIDTILRGDAGDAP